MSNQYRKVLSFRTYQPLAVALGAVQVEELDGDGLSLEAGAELVVDESFVDGAEAAFSDETSGGEALCHNLNLSQSEHMNVGAGEGYGQVLRQNRPWIAQIHLRNSLERILLRRHLLRRLRRHLAAADRRQKRPPRHLLLHRHWLLSNSENGFLIREEEIQEYDQMGLVGELGRKKDEIFGEMGYWNIKVGEREGLVFKHKWERNKKAASSMATPNQKNIKKKT